MSALTSTVEIFKDIIGIIYLHLYGIFAFASLPFRYLIPGKLKNLDDEIILIVGTSSGLMQEICLELTKTKAKLILWDQEETVHLLAQELRNGSAKIYPYAVDLSDRNSIETVSNQVIKEIGDVTVVINASNIAPVASLLSQSPTEIENTFNCNLLSCFWTAQKFLPKMIEKNHGHFIAIAAQAGSWGTANMIPYFSSKCGIRGFLESLEDEVRNHLGNPDIKFTTAITSFPRTREFLESENGNKFRFESLFPVMDDKYVATNIVQGFRRNFEILYVPSSLGVLLWMENWVPTAFNKKMKSFFLQNVDRNVRHA